MSSGRAPTGTGEVPALAAALTAASRALVAVAIRSVNTAPGELTMTQYRVLVILATRGELSIGSIAERIAVDQSNASRLCDRLQRLGLVSRSPSPADRRSVVVTLTAKGRGLIETVDRHRSEEIQHILTGMDPGRVPELLEALAAFTEAADAAERAEPGGA